MAKEAGKVETRGRPRVSENSRLTGKQIKFVELVATREGQDTLRNLAAEAGFSVKGAHTRAYEMLNPNKSPHIVKALRERRRGSHASELRAGSVALAASPSSSRSHLRSVGR